MFSGFLFLYTPLSIMIRFGGDQLVTFSVDVDNLNRIIIFQVLAQFSDIHVHATRIEIVVIDPDSLQGKVALQDFVSMRTKQSQQFRFFGSQFRLFVADSQDLLLGYQT